jgi:hypothetical protein
MKEEKYIDEEEKDFIESFERGEWQTIDGVVKEAEASREYARNTLKKDKRIHLHMEGRWPTAQSLGERSSSYAVEGHRPCAQSDGVRPSSKDYHHGK